MKIYIPIYIPTNDDAYGDSTDEQIEAVRRRMEIIARELGYKSEEIDTQLGYPEDSHDLNEIVFEVAMDCCSSIPDALKSAASVADEECPIHE